MNSRPFVPWLSVEYNSHKEPMANEVQFETETEINSSFSKKKNKNNTPKLVRLVQGLSFGLIKSKKQADYVIIALFFISSVLLFITIASINVEIPAEALKNPEYGLPIVD